MNIVEVLRSAGRKSIADMTELFRMAWAKTDAEAPGTEVPIWAPNRVRSYVAKSLPVGLFSDILQELSVLGADDRFEAVLSIIEMAVRSEGRSCWANRPSAEAIAETCENHGSVQFSYDAAVLPCLLFAYRLRNSSSLRGTILEDRVRFAGSPRIMELVFYASRYLGAPVGTTDGLPWLPQRGRVDNEERPALRLNVAMPEGDRSFDGDKISIAAAKATRIPRASVRGVIDTAALALSDAAFQECSTVLFLSEKTCQSAGQAKRHARILLLNQARLSDVAEIEAAVYENAKSRTCVLVLNEYRSTPSDYTLMRLAPTVSGARLLNGTRREVSGRSQRVPLQKFVRTGQDLSPRRYLSKRRTEAKSFGTAVRASWEPERFRVADFFDVIRATHVRSDPAGIDILRELGPKDISPFGEISGSSRTLSVRDTRLGMIDSQRIRRNDVLLVHRTHVGRVALVEQGFDRDGDIWVGQGITVLRALPKRASDLDKPSCDPRLLYMYLISGGGQSSIIQAAEANSNVTPIGDVERIALPEHLLQRSGSRKAKGDEYASETRRIMLDLFVRRRGHIDGIRRIEKKMSDEIGDMMYRLRH